MDRLSAYHRHGSIFGADVVNKIYYCVQDWIDTLDPQERTAAEARTKEGREPVRTTIANFQHRSTMRLIGFLKSAVTVSSMGLFMVPDTANCVYGTELLSRSVDHRLAVYALDKLFHCVAFYNETTKMLCCSFRSALDFKAFFRFDTEAAIATRAIDIGWDIRHAEVDAENIKGKIKRAEEAISQLEKLRSDLKRSEEDVATNKTKLDSLLKRFDSRKATKDVAKGQIAERAAKRTRRNSL